MNKNEISNDKRERPIRLFYGDLQIIKEYDLFNSLRFDKLTKVKSRLKGNCFVNCFELSQILKAKKKDLIVVVTLKDILFFSTNLKTEKLSIKLESLISFKGNLEDYQRNNSDRSGLDIDTNLNDSSMSERYLNIIFLNNNRDKEINLVGKRLKK